VTDINELKRLAQHATDDAWEARGEEVNAVFFAAANPVAVLALIERVERATEELNEARRKLEIRKRWDVAAETCLADCAEAVRLGGAEPIRTFSTDGPEFAHLVSAVKSNVERQRSAKAERDALRERVERAEADNAALLKRIDAIGHSLGIYGNDATTQELIGSILREPHVGAAMLTRVATLEALLRKHARRVPCPSCGGIGSRTCSTCDNGEREHLPPEVMAALEGK